MQVVLFCALGSSFWCPMSPTRAHVGEARHKLGVVFRGLVKEPANEALAPPGRFVGAMVMTLVGEGVLAM